MNVEGDNSNALSQIDENEKIDTNDNELKKLFENMDLLVIFHKNTKNGLHFE